MVLRTSTTPLSLNAITKDVILDKAATKVLSSSTIIQGLMLNIGGDIRVAGVISIDVEVANPNIDAIGSETMASIQLTRVRLPQVVTLNVSTKLLDVPIHTSLIRAAGGQPSTPQAQRYLQKMHAQPTSSPRFAAYYRYETALTL